MLSEIDQKTLARRLADGDAFVLDVREAREYRAGHVPGALNIPLSILPVRMHELPRNKQVLVICQAGGRSTQATLLLRAVGVDAYSVSGGTVAWIAAGRPVATAAG